MIYHNRDAAKDLAAAMDRFVGYDGVAPTTAPTTRP